MSPPDAGHPEPVDDRRTSKLLSLVLRHDPGRIGISLDPAGWVPIEQLLDGLCAHGRRLTRPDLERIVATNDKQRFAIDPATDRIRASQGHSVAVELGLTAQVPPPRLFHGTSEDRLEVILRRGLHRAGRHAVHLSPDATTARRVGSRHGRPRVLVVDAARMHQDGHEFTRSDNGVWLVEHVPAAYLTPRGHRQSRLPIDLDRGEHR